MLRAIVAAAFIWLGLTGAAHACMGPTRGVIFDTVPWDAPADALVLRVEFDRAEVRRLAGGHPPEELLLMEHAVIDARVLEVVRGEYDQSTVRVAIGGSSCDTPFIFGERGVIIGAFVTPEEGQAFYDAYYSTSSIELRLMWPFKQTVFSAITENQSEREIRGWGLSQIGNWEGGGDFDGDGHRDVVGFFEDAEGHLMVAVERASRREPIQIWGGDIASLPYYEIHVAPAGHYITACGLYGPDCGGAPREVTLAHAGIIVRGLEPRSDTLYYWASGRFDNIIINE